MTKVRKAATLLFLIVITLIFWFSNYQYPLTYLEKGFYTFLVLAILYLVFKSILEEMIAQQIDDLKMRYSFRKTMSILYVAFISLAVIRIWVEDTQTLLVTYGLVAAGVAVALQDFFKNFAGGIVIFLTGLYTIGDRIEIDSQYGDVIDIGILYTTFLELKRWVAGDQATGGLTIVPNGYVLSKTVNNYTKDNNFIWDELEIPITYESDWKEAYQKMLSIVYKETAEMTGQAEKELSALRLKYYLSERDVAPAIYIQLTDNWISFHIRYITDVRQRRAVASKLSRLILEEIQQSANIKIASTTVNIVGFPEKSSPRK
ncbi:MAG: mechanosensitive ion channel family protein [Theionarchaea archaeon]|nr:mechanosensitive ion channel family protein [Theionarchaea archaeon]